MSVASGGVPTRAVRSIASSGLSATNQNRARRNARFRLVTLSWRGLLSRRKVEIPDAALARRWQVALGNVGGDIAAMNVFEHADLQNAWLVRPLVDD